MHYNDLNFSKPHFPLYRCLNGSLFNIQIYVMAIPKLDEKNMEFHLDMYFRQFWHDRRLAYGANGNSPVRKIKHADLKKRVWVPDPFFVNQKEGRVLDNPADNTLFAIESMGDVLYSSRQLVTTSCNMDLKNYPFDVQECGLEIESFSHTTDEVLYVKHILVIMIMIAF